ncbi:MAG: hypothetical protein ACFFAN_18885, partial [Promethearchaeota archaeon]
MKIKEKINKAENFESIDIKKYPITTNAFTWPRMAIFLYIFLHIFSLMIPSILILTFFSYAMMGNFLHWRILIIMVDIMAWWGLYLIISLFLGKLILIL